MLEQVLSYLNNWFVTDIVAGAYTIEDGKIELSFLQNGQYFRIVGSVFNDGLHCYDDEMELKDESFEGAVWALAVPNMILDISKEIEQWQAKYGESANSPYTSESFGGYSYSKGSGSEEASWQSKFSAVLAPYRKLKDMGPYAGGGSHQDPPYVRPFNPEFPFGG